MIKAIGQGLLLGALFLLVGCQKPKEAEQAPTSGLERTSSLSDSSTTVSETTATESETSTIVSENSSRESEAELASNHEAEQVWSDLDARWEEAYSWSLAQIAADTSEGHASYYTFYDIDNNGSKELLTGHLSETGIYYLAAIYYLKNGQPTYLAQSFVASAGGRREGTAIYTDGTVAYYFWHSASGDGYARLYQLLADNSGHQVLDAQDFEAIQFPDYGKGRTELDINTLDWRSF